MHLVEKVGVATVPGRQLLRHRRRREPLYPLRVLPVDGNPRGRRRAPARRPLPDGSEGRHDYAARAGSWSSSLRGRREVGLGVFFTINVRIESERHRVYTGPTGRHDAMTTATPRRAPEARPRATYQDVHGRTAPPSGRDPRWRAVHQPPTGNAARGGGVTARLLPHGSLPGRARRPGRLVDHRRARAAPRRRCPCTRHRRLAPVTHAETRPTGRTSRSRRTGSARSSRHRPAGSTSTPSARSTHERVYATCGSSTPADHTLEAFELTAGAWTRVANRCR